MLGNSRAVERLMASQEGLSSMEFEEYVKVCATHIVWQQSSRNDAAAFTFEQTDG
jgi:hypothetical protein